MDSASSSISFNSGKLLFVCTKLGKNFDRCTTCEHCSPTVTEVYSHLQPEHLHSTVNKITVSMK
jgi:hypothetical protein